MRRRCGVVLLAVELAVVSSGLTGCGLTRTSYVRPAILAPATYAHADHAAPASLDEWWHGFDDRQLDALVEQALERNTDLAVAALRVRAATFQQHLAVINPTLTAGYNYEYSKPFQGRVPATQAHNLSAAVGYEVDLWGRLGAVRDAAVWETRATEQDRRSAALALIGTTIDLYYELAELNQRVTLADQSIAYAGRTLDLVKGQAAFGAATKLEVAESEQSLESQRAARTELIEQRIEARNALTVLLDGMTLPESAELPVLPVAPPPAVAAGLPVTLLERRPDLQSAELRLRETLASTDATRLSFYPQLTLTGGAGTATTQLSQVLQNPVGTLTAALTAPFLQFNQAKYSTQLARTQMEEATVVFRKTLLQALYDVDNALSARTQLAEEAAQLERSLAAAKEVERLFEIRYRSGAVALQLWLNAQETRRQAEISLASNRLQRLQNYATVCQALGGDARRL
jgi:NodT family efflux transporter outer membrane factor (OMF) lipoprotein